MVHPRIESYPYGLTDEELLAISGEDIYDTFEIYDTLEEALDNIKTQYGEVRYNEAKEEAEIEIASAKQEIGLIHAIQKAANKLPNYTMHVCFFEDPKSIRCYFWLPTGRVVVVEHY